MNRFRLSLVLAALAGVPTLARAKLTTHEWGTFTVLQAPDGGTLQWYLASRDLAPLPPFVLHAMRGTQIAGKTGTAQLLVGGRWIASAPYSVRMETPVLYFYPDAPMDVKVAVDFPGGEITEFFPKATYTSTGAAWQGSLVPATPEALQAVPEATGPLARHYAAARAVPEAWLFRNTEPVKASVPSVPPVPPRQSDHFIFYRGAGNNLAGLPSVRTKDDRTFFITNNAPESIPFLFMLRVTEGRSVWKRMEMPGSKANENGFGLPAMTRLELPEATEPLAVSIPGLKAEMLGALEKEGLTKAEAAAMVVTWDNLWFEEPSTRLLAVMPRAWADRALPLKIDPKPESLDRVFVARVELISVAQQATLAALLDHPPSDPAASQEALRKLALGRFAPGAVDCAVAAKEREMRERFAQLTNPERGKPLDIASELKSSLEPEDLRAVREGMKKVVREAGGTIPASLPAQ